MQHPAAAILLLIFAALLATGLVLAQSSNPQAQQFLEEVLKAHAEDDAQQAIDLYRKAIEADPQFVEACLRSSELLAVLHGQPFTEKGVYYYSAAAQTWVKYSLSFDTGYQYMQEPVSFRFCPTKQGGGS